MHELTRRLWAEQDRHPGDRQRLFSAVTGAFDLSSAVYPGSFVDIAPSFVFQSVTYIDSDRRAAAFFADTSGVTEIIASNRTGEPKPTWRFIHSDYTADLDNPPSGADLLISLYAGFVSEHCTRYLKPGGLLLVNSSHGDAAMASLDSAFGLIAVVNSRSGSYAISTRDLDTYLVSKKDVTVSVETLHQSGRGIAYTRSPFAYVFQLRNAETGAS